MKRRLLRTTLAEGDTSEIANYLADEVGLETALRFLSALEESFEVLLTHAEAGRVYVAGDARLAGLRAWRVHQFERYLIFYKPSEEAVTIFRVLHGSRDLWAILGLEST